MKAFHRNIVALLFALLLASTAYCAELVMKNGRFYTVDKSRPWAEAVAIENGRYVYVGDSGGVNKFVDSDTAAHDDLGGAPAIRITFCHLEVIDDADLDRFKKLNIFEVPPSQIKSTKPTAVLMEGKLASGTLP